MCKIETKIGQNRKIGEAAILYDFRNDKYVYNLITKERYFHKPTYQSITKSIEYMCNHAKDNHVKHICMPKIGCGLDRLQWKQVSNIISKVFVGTGIAVTVYML